MLASYKFIQKLFLLNEKIKKIKQGKEQDQSIKLSKFINQYLFKIERNLSNFHYNVIIANIYEAYSFFTQLTNDEFNYSNLVADYCKFLVSLTLVAPHLSNECLEQLEINEYEWPKIDEKFLINEDVNIVVQINGKKRGMFLSKKDILEKDLVESVINDKNFAKFLKENKIKKYFFVKNRLINFLI